jgi:hypothetical protein
MPDCTLAQGFTPKTCKTPSGTIEFMITEFANVSSITKTSGVITAISMASGKRFWQYKQKPEVANWKETQTADLKSGAYKIATAITFDINSLDSATKIETEVLLKNAVVVIAKDADGTYWLLGENNGIEFDSIAWDGGTEYSSFRGAKVSGKHMGFTPVAKVTDTLIASLLIPQSP